MEELAQARDRGGVGEDQVREDGERHGGRKSRDARSSRRAAGEVQPEAERHGHRRHAGRRPRAESFLAAFLPEEGLGVALKIADGNSRSRVGVFLTLLKELKLLDGAAEKELSSLFEVEIVNSVGGVVGRIHPCPPHAGPGAVPAPRGSSQDVA